MCFPKRRVPRIAAPLTFFANTAKEGKILFFQSLQKLLMVFPTTFRPNCVTTVCTSGSSGISDNFKYPSLSLNYETQFLVVIPAKAGIQVPENKPYSGSPPSRG